MIGPTILVVDDQEEIRIVLRRVLSRAGYRVLDAAGGDDALVLVRANSVAAVILDLHMPQKPGEEVLRELKAMAPELPVIVVSGALQPSVTERLLQNGAEACLDKPVDSNRLVELIAGVVIPRRE